MSYQDRQRAILEQILAGSSGVSVVPMKGDFRTDKALCLTGIAFPPPLQAEAIVQELIEPLRRLEPHHHYYRPDELHLTVKGVQVVSDPPTFTSNDEAKVDALFAERLPKQPAILFNLERVVRFATSAAVFATCDDSFRTLVQNLDTGLKDIGVPDNNRYISDEVFFGNITFCRFTQQPSPEFEQALASLTPPNIQKFLTDTVCLVVCNAVCDADSRRIVNRYRLKRT